MGPLEAVRTCFAKYADFRGAASRPEYWWFTAFYLVLSIVLSIIGVRLLTVIVALLMILPTLAVTIRRHHDAGRSGWWILTSIIWPWEIVLLCYPTKTSNNKYVEGRGESGVTEASLSSGAGYCPVCGKLRLPGQTFCSGCGAKFDA